MVNFPRKMSNRPHAKNSTGRNTSSIWIIFGFLDRKCHVLYGENMEIVCLDEKIFFRAIVQISLLVIFSKYVLIFLKISEKTFFVNSYGHMGRYFRFPFWYFRHNPNGKVTRGETINSRKNKGKTLILPTRVCGFK